MRSLTGDSYRLRFLVLQLLACFIIFGTKLMTASAQLPLSTARHTGSPTALKTSPQLVLQLGHRGLLSALAYTPDGRWLATGSRGRDEDTDGGIILLDGKSGEVWRTIEGGVDCLTFAPDGKTMASGSFKDIRLWDVASGSLKAQWHSPVWVRALRFTQDGQTLVTAGNGPAVQVWDVATGQIRHTFNGTPSEHTSQPEFFQYLDVSPAMDLVIASSNNQVQMWDMRSGTALHMAEGEAFLGGGAVAFAPDGKILAAGGALWDMSTRTRLATLNGQLNRSNGLAFSGDGTLLLSCQGNLARLWDVHSGKLLRQFQHDTDDMDDFGGHLAPALSPDGSRVVTVSDAMNAGYPEVTVWGAQTGKRLGSLRGHRFGINVVDFSADGRFMSTDSDDDVKRIWELATGRLVRATHHAERRDGAESAVRVLVSPHDHLRLERTPQGEFLMQAEFLMPGPPSSKERESKTLHRVSARSKAQRETRPKRKVLGHKVQGNKVQAKTSKTPQPAAKILWRLPTPQQAEWSAVFSDDGQRLLLCEGPGRVQIKPRARILDADTGHIIANLPLQAAAGALGFSQDGRIAVGTAGGYALYLWDADTGKLLHTLRPLFPASILECLMTPDDKGVLIATGGMREAGDLEMFDLRSGRRVWASPRLPLGISVAEYSPDEQHLVTGSQDWSVRIWNWHTGRIEHTMLGHDSQVNDVRYTPDGKVLASVANDWSVKFWNPRTGQLLATWQMLPPDHKPDDAEAISHEYLLYTPAGYYTGTPGATRYIRWRVGEHLYPASRYAAIFQRPHLMAQLNTFALPPNMPNGTLLSAEVLRLDSDNMGAEPGGDSPGKVADSMSRPLEITANVLQQAEAAWTEKSYARALSLYREALKTASVPDSDEVEFRIAQALGETKQWDAAIEAGDELIAKTNNKARVLYWVARLYQKVQHYGWRVGNKIYHNDVYPKVNDASKPEAGWFLREDAQRSLDYLERAKLAAASERTWKTPSDKPAGHPLTAVEEIQLDLDLAALLPAVTLVDFAKWLELNDSVPLGETIDTTQSYDRGWHLPKKVLYLYEEVRRLDLTPKHHSTVVALLAESEFLETYERAMQAWQQRMAREKQRLPHYPYESLHAMDLWQAIQQEFPDDPLAPTAQLMIAYHWNGYDASGRPRQALAAFRTLIARYPQSLWVSDARAGIKNITQPLMQITLPTTGAPGQNIKMRYQARNVRRIECHAYRINKLEDVILHAKALADRESRFGDFNAFFGSLDNLPQRFGVSVASWTIAPRGVEEYRLDSGTMTTPLKQPGAYIVVAQGGQQKWAQVVLISDLALLKLADSKQGLVLAVNARTGRPLPGVNVLIKEFYEEPEKGASASVLRGVTNANGQFAKKKSCPRGYFSQIAFAWFNGRYAWTGAGHGHGYEAAYSRQEPYRFYIYTDRPVYRPGQRLYFRQIVTQQQGNRLVPLKKAKVRVTISEPYRTQLYQVILTTSEFGTINGSFTLPQVLRLGEYEIKAELITTTDTRGYPQTPGSSTKFRIEEYKRPEYIVTVETPTTAVRAGSKVKATIQVRYYFGAPVPHAEVEYVVRRRESQVTLNQDSSYNWFHPEQLNPEWSVRLESQKREQLVQSGRVTTDSQGNAAIEIPTELMTPSKPPVQISQVSVDEGSVSQMDHEYGHMDHEYSRSEPDPSPHQSVLYTVQAEVTDASRRTVTGAGHIQVTAQSYFAFLKSPLGYYHAGETVPVRITTRDANDHPVSAAAKVTVYQLLPRQAQREVYTARAQTDAGGHSTWNWPHAQTGQFRIVYEAGQSASDKITATLDVWVQGATFDHTPLRLQGAQLLPEQPFYAPEGKARVLLVVSKPDTRVLLAQVVGDTIVESDMVTVLGKSREIVIPLRPGYGPNFALVAALVKDYQVYRTRTDILIPPRQSLLHIKVASDKSVYKPGQRGVFQIEATDWRGQPARAELSLALFDKSLLAVQQDETQDIQVFHYGAPRQTYYSFDSHQSVMVQTVSQPDRYDGYEAHDWESMEHLGQMQLRPGAGWTDYMSVPGNAYMSVVGNTIMMSYSAGATMDTATPDLVAKAESARTTSRANRVTHMGEDKILTPAQVRSHFDETAFWSPAVVTNGGRARLEITFPDSLTQWQATARGITTTAAVGSGEHQVNTRKNLMVRLQAPRFFVEHDQVVLSANIHNYLRTDKHVKVSLRISQLNGTPGTGEIQRTITNALHSQEVPLQLVSLDSAGTPHVSGVNLSAPDGFVEVKAGQEVRVNWLVNVVSQGRVSITMTAQSDEESDGARMDFPVLAHGIQRFIGWSGVLHDDKSGAVPSKRSTVEEQTQTVIFKLPVERRKGASRLTVQLNPSLAATMLDALPYLADYPYGCVEQTVDRFLPSVLVAKSLRESGVDLKTLRQRAQAYAAQANTRPAGANIANTGYTYPTGLPGAHDVQPMASELWYYGRTSNPLYSETTLNRMIQEGLARLSRMENWGGGGWGWWPDSDHGDPYMTALVVEGLITARSAGVQVDRSAIIRGCRFLLFHLRLEDDVRYRGYWPDVRLDPALQTWLVYVLSLRTPQDEDTSLQYMSDEEGKPLKDVDHSRRITLQLFEQRDQLSPYAEALLALTLWNIGEHDKAGVVLRNLENTAQVNEAHGMVHWQQGSDWWDWWNDDVETDAWVLRAYLKINPKHHLVPMLVKWLAMQMQGNHWRSTKETAMAVAALANYVHANHELDVDYQITVKLNGKVQRTYRVTHDNALYFDNRLVVDDTALQEGDNQLTIETQGRGNLYWNASLEYFSQEDPIPASSHEITVHRRYFKLTPGESDYSRTQIRDGDELQSGDLIEVEINVDANNSYDYLVFEDMKPAGLEPVELRSGSSWGDGLSSNVELRDEKVAFFVDHWQPGSPPLRYRMRAETPGKFHALPTNGYAMYAPDVRATSDEYRLATNDAR